MVELTADRSNGTYSLDGSFVGYFLENRNTLIPAGTYKVILSRSGRAERGTLWTPWDDFVLPELVNVPGRTAIRIHAANHERELEGCIALGLDRAADEILHSRLAIVHLKDHVRFPFWITLKEPSNA